MKSFLSLLFIALLMLPVSAFAVSFSSVTAASGTEPIGCKPENVVKAFITSSAGANTSAIAAQGAGVNIYLDQVIVYNNGASNGAILFTDGSGGSTFAKVPFPASTGTTINFQPAVKFSANTAIFADPTGSDDINITLLGCLRNF